MTSYFAEKTSFDDLPEFIELFEVGYMSEYKETGKMPPTVRYVPERTCTVVARYEARHPREIGNEQVKLSCGHYTSRHDMFCPRCGARVVD